MIEVITTKEGFKSLEEEWMFLYSHAADVTFFQTFSYNWIAWNTFSDTSDQLYIIVYRTGKNELQAIFPFYIDKRGFLRFINDVHTDFCNIIVQRNLYTIYNLMNDVWKHVEGENSIKFLMLDNVVQTSPLLTFWKVFFGNAFVFSQTEHSWLECFKSENIFEEFKHLTAKERKRLITLEKKSSHCKLEIFHKKDNEYPEKQVNSLIQSMEQSGIRSSNYLNERMKSFMRALYDNGLVEIPILTENEIPVSLGFRFVNESRDFVMTWVILYKDKQYNLWNNSTYIVKKAKQGDITIDFGRGGYDYKMSNFRPKVENLYRMMVSKTVYGNWYVLFKLMASHLRKTIKKYRK